MKTKFSEMSNLSQRVLVAIIAIPLIILAIYLSEFSFLLLFASISTLILREFYTLVKKAGSSPLMIYGLICGLALNLLTFFIQRGDLPVFDYVLLVPFFAITFFIKLFQKGDDHPFDGIAYTFLGLIYIAVPFALVNSVVVTQNGYKPGLILGILLILWGSDSGAYFVGRMWGKTKLFERVSPKKTWEGFIGGALTALLIAFLYSKVNDDLYLWQWLTIACITAVFGTLGDLVESLFKRSIAIKDSANSIPGHGGFLDRFDAFLLSIPFIFTFLKIFS